MEKNSSWKYNVLNFIQAILGFTTITSFFNVYNVTNCSSEDTENHIYLLSETFPFEITWSVKTYLYIPERGYLF